MSSILLTNLHAIHRMLLQHPQFIQRIYITTQPSNRINTLLTLSKQQNIPTQIVKGHKLTQLVHDQRHQGMIAQCQQLPRYQETDLPVLLDQTDCPLLLILDGITDPHNLGACLRSADAAGVHAVIAPKDKAVGLTTTVRKIACGAAETIPFIQVTNLVRTLRSLQEHGIWLFGTASEAKTSLYQQDFSIPIALVMGAEGKGLRRLTREHCDNLVSLPMLGSVSSLNVSVATGICLFEIIRQRLTKSP